MGNNKILAGRPRVTLIDLHTEWLKGTKTRRRSIQKHWPRSVRMMLKEMITRHPDSFDSPTKWEQFKSTYIAEVEVWWADKFGNDGVAIDYSGGGFTEKIPPAAMVPVFLYMARMDASVGDDWETDPAFNLERVEFMCSVAYVTAWRLRHEAGEGGGRPAMFASDGWKPQPDWTHADYAAAGVIEWTEVIFRKANTNWFHSLGKPYKVVPLTKPDGWIIDMLDGATPFPENIKPPVGEHGRRMVPDIVEDQFGHLGLRLREQTVEEYTAEYNGNNPLGYHIRGWDYKPTITPRELMRPFLSGTPHEYLLVLYSDKLVHYDLPLDEEEVR